MLYCKSSWVMTVLHRFFYHTRSFPSNSNTRAKSSQDSKLRIEGSNSIIVWQPNLADGSIWHKYMYLLVYVLVKLIAIIAMACTNFTQSIERLSFLSWNNVDRIVLVLQIFCHLSKQSQFKHNVKMKSFYPIYLSM